MLFEKCHIYIIAPQLTISGGAFGRVDINYDGQVGTICAKEWTIDDARVICKQSGYADGKPFVGASGGSGPVYMDTVKCNGLESSIFMCNNSGWEPRGIDTKCTTHSSDAGVMCYRSGMYQVWSCHRVDHKLSALFTYPNV